MFLPVMMWLVVTSKLVDSNHGVAQIEGRGIVDRVDDDGQGLGDVVQTVAQDTTVIAEGDTDSGGTPDVLSSLELQATGVGVDELDDGLVVPTCAASQFVYTSFRLSK